MRRKLYTLCYKVICDKKSTRLPADVMKIFIINPPHPAIGSRIPREHLPPLGLLALGGPLLDAGHRVELLDAEFGPMGLSQILAEARVFRPEAVLLGHSGSTSGHPSAVRIARAIRNVLPDTWIIYGGVFPTYHWQLIMTQEPDIDFIVRGEGEETIVRLIRALEQEQPLRQVPGIVYREGTAAGRFRMTSGPGAGNSSTIADTLITAGDGR